jgi:hypothetical protein
MHFNVAQFEEASCFTIAVILKTLLSKQGIFESYLKRRALAPHRIACRNWLELGLEERIEASVRGLVKKSCPSFKPLLSSQNSFLHVFAHVGNSHKVFTRLMLHGRLPEIPDCSSARFDVRSRHW